MQLKSIFLAAVCGALAWGGYEVSHLRAGMRSAPFSEVLAAAGGESGFLLGSDGSSSDRNYRISSLSVFSNVALHVKDNYVEPDRIDPKAMLVASLNEIERQIAEVLVEDAGKGRLSIKVMDEEKLLYIDDVESLWEINLKLREVFRFFEKHLPPQQDVRAIEYAAVNGALSTLDPHSVLLKPEAFAEMKTSTKGEFGGLGIVISVRDGKLTIISPLDGTPASRAGLEAGDVISRIGDVSTVSMPIEEAVRMLRGPEGSKVTIWIDRKGWADSRRFNIVRERIKIESVESKLLANRIGYIKIKNFQQNTGKDLDERLEKLAKEAGGKLSGVVLDLRNNPGGLLEQAIRVSDKFLTSGDIVTTVGYGNKLREPKRARWSGTESEVPVAVLVNKGSASASEIVAGALKNLDRAVVIGERTFGKGSVQVLYDFADNSALKLTIAQYLTPGGISIQNEGVTPDIELKPAWIEEKSVRLFYEPKGHRERNLKSHLDRAGKQVAMQQPKFELTYLLEQDKEEASEDGEEEEAPAPADGFVEDYQVKFAREFLLSVGRSSRSKMLQVGRDFLEKREASEIERIAARLGDLKVDWSERPDKGVVDVPELLVTLGLEDHATNQVTAGDEVQLIARVENRGSRTLHRVRGIIESEHPAFRGREFMFGKLAPEEVRTWKVTTKVAKEASSRSDLLELMIEADEGKVPSKAVLPVVTRYIPHPQFAYSYAFDDEKRGDGDGLLEVGEGVGFLIFVTNTGPGDADDVTLRLKSGAKEDLFLERGRVTVGAIKSGETAVGRLRFRVPTTQSDRGKLPLELTIYDAGTGEWLEDQIDLVAAAASPNKRVAKKGSVATRRDAVVFAGAGSNEVLGTVEKGARFEALAKTAGFTQVKLMEGATGWIKSADLQSSGKPKAAAKVAYAPLRRPPSIALVDDLGGSILDRETVKLEGTITARKLRDMYVLVNDEKVFFKGGPKAKAEAAAEAKDWIAPNDAAVTMPFEVDLALEEGLNKVLVVARLDEKVITYRSLFVSRRAGSTPAVAEAREKPSSDKKAN